MKNKINSFEKAYSYRPVTISLIFMKINLLIIHTKMIVIAFSILIKLLGYDFYTFVCSSIHDLFTSVCVVA